MYQFSEITINYKPLNGYFEQPSIKSSNDAYRILKTHWSDKISYREEFVILLLSNSGNVLGISKISAGGTTATIADPKMIFQTALKANASGIVLAHNHPSGKLIPSNADLKITDRLVEIGKFLEIKILDHLIITENSFYSFADEGNLYN